MNVKVCLKVSALCLFVQIIIAEYRLESVQVLFRHGERTPREEELYPKLPYDPSIYDELGYGQLTEVGRIREYRIGEKLREIYNEHLGNVYRPGDIYAVSTDFDRTKMSLELVLSGLCPRLSNSTHETITWLPIPILYVPKIVDILLFSDSCPMYIDELRNVRNTKEVLERSAKYNKLFELIAEKTGLNMTANPIRKTTLLHALLSAERSLNISAPEWVTNDVWSKIEEVVDLEYQVRSFNTRMKRLSGGPVIKQFIENMNLDETRENTPKIYLYSAHDVTVQSFAKAHNFTEPKVPHYGSTIIFEKLRDHADKVYVRMMLWTGATEKLITYQLPGGERTGICPIDKYLQLVRSVLPSDEENDCLWNNVTKEELRGYYDRR